MSTHTELPYSTHAAKVVETHRDVVGLWSHFRHLSVDGLSPVLVEGRQNRDETIVRVHAMPDGRNGYWRIPDARYIRRFAEMVASDAGRALTSERVERNDQLTMWTFRFNCEVAA
jgi:hypothetical protein